MSVGTPRPNAVHNATLSRDGFTTVELVVLCQVAHFLTFAAIPLFLPAIRADLQISFTQAGMLSAAGALSYACMQIPAGYLCDRYGPRRLFLIGLTGWCMLSVAFGFVHVFVAGLAVQFAAGAFRALLFAPGLALLASWFPPERRATAMSLLLFGGHAGSVLLSLAGPALAEEHGWRPTFVGFAVLGLAAAWLFAGHAHERPRSLQHRQPAPADLYALVRIPILWLCNALQFVRFAVVMGFNFWLPSFLVSDRGFSLSAAGLVMAMSAALSAPSNTLGAYMSDRLENPPLVIGAALGVLALAAMALPAIESRPLLLLAIAVYSVFQGAYFGPLFLVPIEVLGSRMAGSAIGFSNLFANIGGFLCVYALGAVRDRSGSFAYGFVAIGVLCLLGVLGATVLARMRLRAMQRCVAHPQQVGATG